jgi:guanylate kinase
MRPGEVDGRDYLFVDKARFDDMVKRRELLEWATVLDNHYGTPRAPVEAALSEGHDVLFDIDWQGTQQLREKARADVVSAFILPPSMADLEKRLRSSAQYSAEAIRNRMSRATHELSH